MQNEQTPEQIQELFNEVSKILIGYYSNPESAPASPGVDKRELVDLISEPQLPAEGCGLKDALSFVENTVLPNSVKTWHPLFLNQMSAGASVPAILGDLLSSMINCTMATWEMTPSATIMERNVSQWMAQILGMPEGSSGIFVSGGSYANMCALAVARHQRLDPEIAKAGLGGKNIRGAILCTDGAHYSVANSANFLGIGANNVIKVKSNERNEMLESDLIEQLRRCDEEGITPFAIVVTLGITVTGGFDPLARIVEVCKGRNIHIHVDAAFGGGMALADGCQKYFAGIEQVDTVSWDAHKWMHTPLTSTVLLAPDARIFKHTFSSGADYLFHPQDDEINIADDLGHYTPMCGKRFQSLHVWLLMKAYGANHFREMATRQVRFTETIYRYLLEDEDFVPSYKPVSPIICFQYRPEGCESWTVEYSDRMHRWMRETSKRRKLAMYNITKHKGQDHFRMILINHLTTEEHLKNLLEEMRALGQEFMAQEPPPQN